MGARRKSVRAGREGITGRPKEQGFFLKKAEEKPDAAVSARLKGGPIVGAAGQRMLGQMLHHDNLSVPMCGRGCHTPPDGFQRFSVSDFQHVPFRWESGEMWTRFLPRAAWGVSQCGR